MGRRQPALSPPVSKLQKRFERWRRTRRTPTQIPEDLWAAAVDLARADGVNPIARALRLDYYSLKRRVEAAEVSAPGDQGSRSGFVELALDRGSSGGECLIKLHDGDGAQMTIRGSSSDALDLKGLVAAFLGRP